VKHRLPIVLGGVMVVAGIVLILKATGAQKTTPEPPQTPAFKAFSRNVEQYLQMRSKVPGVRATKEKDEISSRREALAEHVRATRSGAKVGDIFTPEIAKEFRAAIQHCFQGAKARDVRKTIQQGEPLAGWKLTVNGNYPEGLPTTTVPPTLLLALPRLPEKLAYGIIGDDFILLDSEARLIIDYIPAAMP
jgi:hypothetical protein